MSDLIFKARWHECACHEHGVARAFYKIWFDIDIQKRKTLNMEYYLTYFKDLTKIIVSYDSSTGLFTFQLSPQLALKFDLEYL